VIQLGNGVTAVSQLQLVAASLYIDYVYLDTEERRRFAQQSHEYLIDQLQFTGDEDGHGLVQQDPDELQPPRQGADLGSAARLVR